MKKIFLLDNDLMGFFPKEMMNEYFYNIYSENRIKKFLIRLFNKVGLLPRLFLFNHKWVRQLKNNDAIVIFDGDSINKVAESILKKFPTKKIIVWYWNPISKAALLPKELDERINSVWTYDSYDSKKYKINLNSQFYFKELVPINSEKHMMKRDVFFVGADKGREKELKKLGNIFTEENIKFYFHLTKLWNSEKQSDSYSAPLSYPEVILNIIESKAILDLVGDKRQEGMSLRPLESLFLKKKLITNNIFIKKEKMYDPNNVFILGVDDLHQLKDFLRKDYLVQKSYDELIKYYDFREWSKRFEFKNKY